MQNNRVTADPERMMSAFAACPSASIGPVLRRATAVWLVIALAETIHGTLRRILLEPLLGDPTARRAAVITGSLIVLAISFIFVRWLKGGRTIHFFVVGLQWVLMTVIFEIVLGLAVIGASWERVLSDFDLSNGGLLPIGLAIMLFSPAAAAWLTDEL